MATLTDYNGSAEDSDHDLLMDEADRAMDERSRPTLRRYPRDGIHRRLREAHDDAE